MEIPYRSEVPKEQTWDLTRVFKTEADWEAAFKAVKQEVKALPALEDGFTESAAVLYDRLTQIFAVDRRLSKIYVYASMASDVDTSNQKKLALNSRGQSLAAEYQAAVAFIQPAVLALGKEALDAFFKEEPRLENYRHYWNRSSSRKSTFCQLKRRSWYRRPGMPCQLRPTPSTS